MIESKNINNEKKLKIKDSCLTIVDNSDTTKEVQFQCSGLTTATTRTLTVQDSSDTLVGRATTDTLTNKTLTAPTITGTIVNSGIIASGVKQTARSPEFDLDNGAGTTIDSVILRPAAAITITTARIVYDDATTGTVAGGNAKIGTTVAGTEIVGATAYGDTKAVGTTTAMTIASGAVAAGTPVIVRHTGVAATQAGKAHVEIEFDFD